MFSSRNQQISPVREQGERSRRYVYRAAYSGSFGRISTSRFCGSVALSGRGSFAFIVLGNAEPRLGKRNDLRLFFIQNRGRVFLGQGETPQVLTDGGRHGLEQKDKYSRL